MWLLQEDAAPAKADKKRSRAQKSPPAEPTPSGRPSRRAAVKKVNYADEDDSISDEVRQCELSSLDLEHVVYTLSLSVCKMLLTEGAYLCPCLS